MVTYPNPTTQCLEDQSIFNDVKVHDCIYGSVVDRRMLSATCTSLLFETHRKISIPYNRDVLIS
jgi:hypothetical protein